METVAEYLARFGITVTLEQERQLTEIAAAYAASGMRGDFWGVLPRLILPSASVPFASIAGPVPEEEER